MSGGLHTARWSFQFWLSLPHWLCDLCTRYRGVCGNISSPLPVSFFQCLLLWSTFHMHTKNMDMARERISLILELMAMFLSFQMTFSLVNAAVVWAILDSTSGLDPSSDTIALQIFKPTDSLQFLVVYGGVSADAIGVICLQLGLLCTDLHAICCGGLFNVIYQLS